MAASEGSDTGYDKEIKQELVWQKYEEKRELTKNEKTAQG